MLDEPLDVVDENGRPKGTATRSEIHAEGLWHRTVHVWVFAPGIAGGSVLLQKRSHTKAVAPGLLDVSVGGHQGRGEDPREAAVRELAEEVGIRADTGRLFSLGARQASCRYENAVDNEIQTIFGISDDRTLKEYRPSEAEVAAILHVPARQGVELFTGTRISLKRNAGQVGPGGSMVLRPFTVTTGGFVPAQDNYFLRAFLAADRLQRREQHVFI